MSSNTSSTGPAAWLRERTDAEIAALLDARRDVATPVPAGFAVLASRLNSPSSLGRVAERLTLPDLAVLELLLAEPLDADALARRLRGRALKKQVLASADKLRGLALAWGDDVLHTTAAAREALPWRSTQLTTPPDLDAIDAALAAAGPDERALLDRLAEGSPLGRTAAAGPGTSPDHPVQRMLASGLLARVDHQTVELPWEVRTRLRGELPLGASLKPPVLDGPPVPGADGAGAVAALELLRHADDVLDVLGAVPAQRVKAGGIGIRELRRVAKAAGLAEDRAALLLELLAAAALIAEGELDGEEDSVFAPTVAVDEWLRAAPADRWALLARTWLELRRQPALIGTRGEEGIVGPLHRAARSTVAPQDRAAVLNALAQAPAGTAPTLPDLHAAARFAHPSWYRRLTLDAVADIVAQAQVVGLVAGGALTYAGRAARTTDPAQAMAAALPKPVEEFLLQADLTLTIPGPTTHDFAAAVALVADLESAGGAAVYRVTDASVRRALDAGRTSAEVHAFFVAHSVTPVPQGLTYLVDDVARRHGALRAGVAGSFLRSDDPALVAAVLSSPAAEALALRAVAPTVLIAQVPLSDLVAGLAAAGFNAAAEDSRGVVVDLRPAAIRLPSPRPRPPAAQPTLDQLADAAVQIRRQDAPSNDGPRTSGPELMALLQSAAGEGTPVRLGYVDANGVFTRHVVVPESVRHGQLAALDGDATRRFALHRVTTAEPVE
ncbi:helicase-associated domain-containing protein [Tsukamurella sp. M9C]|uniref:helicase-associated domain-containing protein n=1 Tax=Tsukamurella sp. M9C TaxID=2877520 RepID=UPI001CCEFF35|nr:helicase-associated domain-containing protein [Tsukamurella sp. M9C]MCA0156594.1 helicase-associated domain-containing protein [Tsukamurella sp. M9C]